MKKRGRPGFSAKPTKKYIFMSEIGMISGLTKKTKKSISESIRVAIDYYMKNCKKGNENDSDGKSNKKNSKPKRSN